MSAGADHIGSVEQVLESGQRDVVVGQHHTAPHIALDDECAGELARQIHALGQIRRGLLARIDAELERHAIFLQNVGDALEFAGRRREVDYAAAALDDAAAFRNRQLHVAVKRERRARSNLQRLCVRIGDQLELAKLDSAVPLRRLQEFFPAPERALGRMRGRLVRRCEPLPQTVRGAREGFPLVPHDQRIVHDPDDGRMARTRHRHPVLPSWELLARHRDALTRVLRQFVKETARLRIFDEREKQRFLRLHDGALCLRIEAAHGLDLVAEELDAHRLFGFWRKDVEDAAAHGELADHLDRIALLVADAAQMRDHVFEREFVATCEV